MKARENPFRTERIEALRYRAEGFSWDALEARLQSRGGRGAIVGPRGHGKTTLLLEWAERCRAREEKVILVRLREGQRTLDADQFQELSGCSVFVDSAEQLSFFGWMALRWRSRAARRLVVCTHRPGRLRALMRCRTSVVLLEDLVDELAGSRENCAELWRRHQGNVRDVFFELYARASSATAMRGIPAGSSR